MTATWKGMTVLAASESKRTWLSYLATVLLTLFFVGLVLGFVIADAFLGTEASGPASFGFMTDLLFLTMGANLAYNWAAGSYFCLWRDPFTDRLSFLRGLPVSPRAIVWGRMLMMLAGAAVIGGAFFLPTHLIMVLVGVKFQPAAYLWFVLIWVGYALFSAGIVLWLEMGREGVPCFC